MRFSLAVCAASGAGTRAPAQDPVEAGSVVLRGRVLDARSEPLAGARIAVRQAAEATDPEPSTAALTAGPAAVSAADGTFGVRVETERPQWLVIAAAGHATIELPVASLGIGPLGIGSRTGGSGQVEVALPAGGTLVGSVRDAVGALLAGVEVVALDALRDVKPLHALVVSSNPFQPRVVGRTDARGLFRLDGVLRTAVSLRFDAPGYASLQLGPHALGDPLVVELQPVGMVRGRILDADGRPVVATVELRAGAGERSPRPVRSAADGAFEIGVPAASARELRIVAAAVVDGAEQVVDHGPIDGPRDGLVLTLGRPEPAAAGSSLRISAVDRATGAALPSFRAAIAWGASGPGRVAELALRQVAGQLVTGTAGVVQLPSPARAGPGVLLVGAPAHAWTRVEDFALPAEDERSPAVELPPEAVLRGRVVDPISGAGVAGAQVGWLPHSGGRMRQLRAADRLRFALDPTTSAADGAFELRGVPEGLLELLVDVHGRPPIEPVEIEVDEGARRDGLVVDAPSGRTLRGTVTGVQPILASGRQRVAARPLAADPAVFARASEHVADLEPDGAFVLGGLAAGFYALDLLLPREPRGGSALRIPLEAFRVRADVEPDPLRLDAAADLPGRVGGRLTVVGGALPRTRLAVVAEDEVRQLYVNPGYAFGPLALPGADGRFVCWLRSGSYRLRVFDVATGVELGRREGVTVEAGEPVEVELSVEVVPLTVRVTRSAPDATLRAARLEILVAWPSPARTGTAIDLMNSSNDTGLGVALRDHTVPCPLFVPALPTLLRLWGASGAGAKDEDRKGAAAPLAESEFTPDAVGRRVEVELIEVGGDDERR